MVSKTLLKPSDTPSTNQAYVIKVNGEIEQLGHQPTLAEAQKLVGGYVEQMPRSYTRNPRQTIVGDEEGKLKHKPVNPVASELVFCTLVGGILVLEGWRSLK